MQTQVPIEHESHLIALGLSVSASDRVRVWHQHQWRSSGDIRALALPPLIPLSWHEVAHIDIPKMPRSIIFDEPINEGECWYLSSRDEHWTALLDRLGTLLRADANTPPFPAFPGIFMGIAPPEFPQEAITNNDWRLLRINCLWHLEEGKVVHLRHTVEMERHLS